MPLDPADAYAAISLVSERGEAALRRRRGLWDTAGDLLLIGAVLASLVLAAVAVFSDLLPVLSGLLLSFTTLVVGGCAGVAAWFRAESPRTGEDALVLGIARCGGAGQLPAYLPLRFPSTPIRAAADEYVAEAGLAAPELETFRTLQSEGFIGTLADLVATCRMLNR